MVVIHYEHIHADFSAASGTGNWIAGVRHRLAHREIMQFLTSNRTRQHTAEPTLQLERDSYVYALLV